MSIKTNELRIGNWVHCPVTKRNGIIVAIETGDRPIVNTGTDTVYTESYSGTDCLEGIPLTPEILEKCGIPKSGNVSINKWWAVGDEVYLKYYDSGEFGVIVNDWQTTKIQYLHQLQNLYFSLTGTEITIAIKIDWKSLTPPNKASI